VVLTAKEYALLEHRVDNDLRVLINIAATSLANDHGEGQDIDDAARSTAAELSTGEQMLVTFDNAGNQLAEGGREEELIVRLPPLDEIPSDLPLFYSASEDDGADDRHRLAVRRVSVPGLEAPYLVVASFAKHLKPEGVTRAMLRGRSVRVVVFDTSRVSVID